MLNLSDTIFLVVGESGSGKTTFVEELSKHGNFSTIESYTTRAPRFDGETGHIFVTEDEVPPKEEMVAYTYYNGNHYWATQKQVETNNLYVIDPPGIDFFKAAYIGNKRVIVVRVWCPEETRYARMVARGDSAEAAKNRIDLDREWFDALDYDILVLNDSDITAAMLGFFDDITYMN